MKGMDISISYLYFVFDFIMSIYRFKTVRSYYIYVVIYFIGYTNYQRICQNISGILYLKFIFYRTIASSQIIKILTYTWDIMGSLFSETAIFIAPLHMWMEWLDKYSSKILQFTIFYLFTIVTVMSTGNEHVTNKIFKWPSHAFNHQIFGLFWLQHVSKKEKYKKCISILCIWLSFANHFSLSKFWPFIDQRHKILANNPCFYR